MEPLDNSLWHQLTWPLRYKYQIKLWYKCIINIFQQFILSVYQNTWCLELFSGDLYILVIVKFWCSICRGLSIGTIKIPFGVELQYSLRVKSMRFKAPGMELTKAPGMELTKAPFIYFCLSGIFDLAKVPVKFLQSHLYLTSATTAELQWHLSNINMIFSS